MKAPHSNSRRDFLRLAALGGVVMGSPDAATSALAAGPREADANTGIGKAKNVIFMVADGMNIAALSLAQTYLRRVHDRRCRWMGMYRDLPVVRALCETESASSLVTDSAAAASCWGIGERINNGTINCTIDGRRPTTILQKMKSAKKLTGLVTTATVTHATPAGFVATVQSRSKQALIAPQYLERSVDIVLGGGTQYFDETLLIAFRKAGYSIVKDRSALLASQNSSRLLGLFDKSHMPLEIDRHNDPVISSRTPTLSEMTTVALTRLADSTEGFFLMIEGARIDHAAHANDAAATIHDLVAFDDAIGVVLAYIDKHPDTLLIITTDHGTGGIQLNGLGTEDFIGTSPAYSASTPAFMRITNFTMSLEMMAKMSKSLNRKTFIDLVVQHTRLDFDADDLSAIKDFKTLLAIMPKYTGINWTSHNHTSEMVEFCAFGPGSSLFPPFLRNDEVHGALLKATGIG